MSALHTFYTRLDHLLVAAGLEEPTTGLGCSEVELAAQEQRYGVQFPLAYRLFLAWCGRTSLPSLGHDFRLEFLDYYWDSARQLLAESQATLAPGGFVFGEWQGYNFHYFLLGSANPAVTLCIIKAETEPGLDYIAYGRFTDWLIGRLKEQVKLRQSLGRTHVPVAAVWAELDQLAQLANQP